MFTLVSDYPFSKYKLHFVSKIFLGFWGRDLQLFSGCEKGGAVRSIGMRNRSSAAGDQQVLAAEGCSYAAAFKLAKRHDKHLLL